MPYGDPGAKAEPSLTLGLMPRATLSANFRTKALSVERSFVGSCAQVLRQLNDKEGNGNHQHNVNHAAFVKEKLQHKPDSK
jgi:hypothetical protein